jgi:hypothetical protein
MKEAQCKQRGHVLYAVMDDVNYCECCGLKIHPGLHPCGYFTDLSKLAEEEENKKTKTKKRTVDEHEEDNKSTTPSNKKKAKTPMEKEQDETVELRSRFFAARSKVGSLLRSPAPGFYEANLYKEFRDIVGEWEEWDKSGHIAGPLTDEEMWVVAQLRAVKEEDEESEDEDEDEEEETTATQA